MTYNVFCGTLNPTQSIDLQGTDMQPLKQIVASKTSFQLKSLSSNNAKRL